MITLLLYFLKVWSQSNTLVYCFTLATTIGYGHLTPTDPSEIYVASGL